MISKIQSDADKKRNEELEKVADGLKNSIEDPWALAALWLRIRGLLEVYPQISLDEIIMLTSKKYEMALPKLVLRLARSFSLGFLIIFEYLK